MGGRSRDRRRLPSPAFATPVDAEIEAARPLDLESFESTAAFVGLAPLALRQAILSWRGGLALCSRRWLELAEARAAAMQAAGIDPAEGFQARCRALRARMEAGEAAGHREGGAPAQQAVQELLASAVEKRNALEELFSKGAVDQLYEQYEDVIVGSEARLRDALGDPEIAAAYAGQCWLVGTAAKAKGQLWQARGALEKARRVGMGVDARDETGAAGRLGLLAAGSLLELDQEHGRPADVGMLHASVAFADEARPGVWSDPHVLYTSYQLRTALAHHLLSEGDSDEALKLLASARGVLEQMRQGEGDNVELLLDLSSTINRIGEAHFRRKDVEQAEGCYEEALEIRRQARQRDDVDEAQRRLISYYIAGSCSRLADIYEDRRDPRRAAELFGECAGLRKELRELDFPDPAQANALLWWALSRQADLLMEAGQTGESSAAAREADAVVAVSIVHSPQELRKVLAGVSQWLHEAGKAADQDDAEAWQAWLARIYGTLRALRSAALPLRQYDMLLEELDGSILLTDFRRQAGIPEPDEPAVDTRLATGLRAVDGGDLEAGRRALSEQELEGGTSDDDKLVRAMIEAALLQADGRLEDAAIRLRNAINEAVATRQAHVTTRVETSRRHTILLHALGLGQHLVQDSEQLVFSLRVLYGLDHGHVRGVQSLARAARANPEGVLSNSPG